MREGVTGREDRRLPASSPLAWIGEHAWEVALLCAAAGILCAQVFGHLVADTDLWGHVRFGQLILAEGLPEVDPYAYTSAGHPWINHEILAEVAFGWAYTHFGAAGLQLVRYALVLPIVLLVWREMAVGGGGPATGWLGTALVVSGMGAGIGTIRPHLITYLFFLLVLMCVVRAGRPGTRLPWLVPLIIAVWVNAHGGVLAGVGIVGIWWFGEGVAALSGRGDGYAVFARATMVLLASIVALAANPYGPELPVFLLDTATEARPFISEWRSVAARPQSLFIWLVFTVFGLVVTFRAHREIRLSHGMMLGALALLPLLAIRHVPLYALGWGVLLAPHMPDIVGRLRRRRREWRAAGAVPLVPETLLVGAGVFVGGAGVVVTVTMGSFPCIPVPTGEDGPTAPPREAVAILRRSGVSGNLATPFDWGEYVIWHLGPEVQVGMDGRRETVYPDSTYRAYRAFEVGAGNWYRWLEQYGADMVLVKSERPPDNLLALKSGWRELFRSEVSALYGREDWPGTARIEEAGRRETHAAMAACFPGAPGGAEQTSSPSSRT